VRAVQARARGYLVETDDRAYEAGQIVLATGPFQTPRIPRSRRTWPPACISSTAATTADPTRSQTGPCSWSVAPTRAFRSRASSPQPIGPPRDRFATGSAPAAAWTRPLQCLTATELMGKTVDSRLGRRLSGRDALIGSSPRAIRRQGVHVRPRAIGAAGSTITFIDARPRDGHLGDGLRRQRFLHPLARLRRRRSCHPRARGVTAVPRLYFLGMPWQHNPRLRAHRLGQTRRPTHRRPDLEARIRPRRRPGPTTADGDGIADHLENS
jgi:putative flavoprotein involved in K+ transport